MKILQFYPEAVDKDNYISRLTFEPGGFFIKKDNKVYFNKEELVIMVSSTYELARPTEMYLLSEHNNETESILVKAEDINRMTNVRQQITKCVSNTKHKMKKSERERLFSDLEEATVNSMIDYALLHKDESLFNQAMEYKKKVKTT